MDWGSNCMLIANLKFCEHICRQLKTGYRIIDDEIKVYMIVVTVTMKFISKNRIRKFLILSNQLYTK